MINTGNDVKISGKGPHSAKMPFKTKSTNELENALSGAADLRSFISENISQLYSVEIPVLIENMMEEKGISKTALAEDAGMSRIYLHQILTGKRTPSRDRMISLCLGLKLSLSETQQFLRQTGYAQLYARVKRDAAIIYALDNGWNADRLNDVLYDLDEKTLF